MLHVATVVQPSPIAGLGLFAMEHIRKGQLIWCFDEHLDRVLDLITGNPAQRRFLETYCYAWRNRYYLCADDGRFFNHSDTPNTYEVGEIHTFAARDIAAGEELTSDYRTFGYYETDHEFNLRGIPTRRTR